MEDSTFVSPNSPGGVGGFPISYGSSLPALSSGDKFNALRILASKVSPKLRYRGNYEEYKAWKKTILLLAHAMRVSPHMPEINGMILRKDEKYADMTEPTTDFKIELDAMMAAFNNNSTMLFELIYGAIDFSGPMAVVDAQYVDTILRNYEYGYSWGHLLWKDLEERSGARVDNSAAKFRQEVANNTKWTDTRESRTLLITRISSKFFAWCADPRNVEVNVTGFIKPYLLDHFPVSPGEDVLVKMEGHIQVYLKDDPTLQFIIGENDKQHWIRLFLSQVDVWGKSHGMADGTSGEGDLLLPMGEKKLRTDRAPMVDTNNCRECDCWACNGIGVLAGEGRKVCLCYNKLLDMPKGTTENQKRTVMTCRTFLEYEPDFSPNIKALQMRDVFAKVKEHVNAEKAAKLAKGSFKTTPKPWRSDPDGRFHQGNSNAPMVDEAGKYNDDIEEYMRRSEINTAGDVHMPLVDGVEVEPMTAGEKWEAQMSGHEGEIPEEVSGAEALAALQAELEGFRARERAAELEAARSAPGTREDYFKTPAATSHLVQFSQHGGTPEDRMRQLQFATETPEPKAAPATVKKPPMAANAMFGKALTAFESEKQEVQIKADSPWNAISVLLRTSGNFLMSGNAGRSLLALVAVFMLRYRHVLARKAMWKCVEAKGTMSFVLQWAFANTVLSAQSVFTDKARLFFQAGLNHFGGQVASLDARWSSVPAQDDVTEVPPSASIVELPSLPGRVSVSGPPPVTRSFTPILPSVPGSPSSPIELPYSPPVAVVPSPVREPPAMSMSQIVEAAVADALAKQQAAFSSVISAQVAAVNARVSAAGVVAAVSPTIDLGGQTPISSLSSPSPDAGGQQPVIEVQQPAAAIETVPVAATPAVESASEITVNLPPISTGNGETVAMMCGGSVYDSLGEIQAALRKVGGGIAMSDSGCTFTVMLQSEQIGLIDNTFLRNAVPVTVGDARSVTFAGTDLYCCKMGGCGENAYDALFRAGTYPEGGISNVMSGTILQSIFDFKSTPGSGISFSLPGAPPLTPVIAPNSTAFITLTPLVGPRCAALYRKAIASGMDTKDIHFMCVLPSPVGPGTSDFIMAGVETRKIKGSLVEDPEALDIFSGVYTRKDSYVQLLEANGVTKAVPVDNDPVGGGGEAHNILTNSFYLGMQKKADEGVIGYVHLAPSCKFTCPARIIDRNQGKEDSRSPVMRERGFEDGVLGLSHGHLSLLRQDTNANIRAAAIAMSVGRNGGIVSFETQADRDDASRPDVFWTGAKGHVNAAHIPCYQRLFEVLGMRRATTEFCAWPDDAGRNVCQKSTDFYLSPLLEPLGRDLEDARCGCGPYGHSSNLGKSADGSFGTAGSGPYPNGLIACMAAHVGTWFASQRTVPQSKEVIASFLSRAAAMERPRGAAAGPVYEGVELLIRVHVEIFHASERMVVNTITLMGLRHRIKPGHIEAFRRWSCAICATVLGRRRVFHARPADATLPHEGKVWQMDSVALRFAPWFLAVFNDVASTVSFSWPHASTTADHMIQVISRHRAKIRPTHGEIEILFSDPLTAMRSKDVQEYAADDTVTGHGKGIDIKVGPQGVHEWVSLSENKIGDLTQRSNAALRGAGRSERYQHLAFCAAEAVHNCYWFKAGTETTPMAIFFGGANPPQAPPHCPLHVWGSPCTYTTHPETRLSKYDDRSLVGWYCGPSLRNGPGDYSMAGIVTAHGNVIAWDCGMVKIISEPVMKRLEPHGLPIFESVMPDESIVVSPAASANSMPVRSAPIVTDPSDSAIPVGGAPRDPALLITYAVWKAADDRRLAGRQVSDDAAILARAATDGVSISLPVFSASAAPDDVPAAAVITDNSVAWEPQVVSTPFDVFIGALDRKAKNTALPSDEVWLSGAESRGVAMPDGTVMAAGEVVVPTETFSLKEVALSQRRRKLAADAAAASAPGVALTKSKWGPPLALVGSNVEVEWDKGWCKAHVVSEERQANGRQVFKLFYTDPAEPVESRTQLHHFDNGKQCMNWRPAVSATVSRPKSPVASTVPAVTRSRTKGLETVIEEIDAVGSLDSLTAMLRAEINIAESDDSEVHIVSVEPVMLTDVETGRHVPEMLMANISNSESRIFSMSDATNWDMPGNEREYNRFPQKQVLYELKLKKVELYKKLNTSSLVRRQPEWQVLDGMWIYGKKYNAAASPPCQPTVRYVIKGGPMDPRIYDAHADTVRQSTVEAQLAITATYRLVFRLIDLTQAFQSTPVKPGSKPVYARQMYGFEEVPKGAPAGSTWRDYVQQLHVSFQGTIHGSSGLGFNVQKILTEEAHMNLCMWDRKAFWMYNGPPAATLDEVMAHMKAGRLEGETEGGIPLGWIFITVHADDFPCSSTSEALLQFVWAILKRHYETTSTNGARTLGRNLTFYTGYIRSDCNDYWLRQALEHDAMEQTTPKHFSDPDSLALVPDDETEPVPGEPKHAQFVLMQSATRAIIGAGTWGSSIDPRGKNFFRAAAGFMAHPTKRVHKFCLLALKLLASNPSYKQYGAEDVTTLLLSEHPTVPLGSGVAEAGLIALFDSATRDPRAVTGGAIMLGRAAIDVISAREKIKTTGAHSGESGAAITLLHHLIPVRGLLHEIMIAQVAPTPIYTDSASVLFVSGGGQSIKHTPWLLGRLSVLLEAVERGDFALRKVAGTLNPTNSLTKHTPLKEFMRDMAYFMNRLDGLYDGPWAAQTEVDELMGNVASYVAMHNQ